MQSALRFANKYPRMQTLVFFIVLWSSGLAFTCLDSIQDPVDWYYVYKIPEMRSSADWKVKAGLAHFYLDVNSPVWTLSGRTINESQQSIYETMSPVYNNKADDTMYLMYNDEPPSNLSYNRGGHTKGVVAFNKTAGFWLIHSVPHFPSIKSDGYIWPHTALRYGQTFLCVTFKYATLGDIVTQLLYNQPKVYDSAVSQSILQDFPRINDVINGGSPPGSTWHNVIQLKSFADQAFKSFAKSDKFDADLYDSLVAPTLQQNLLVETWLNGGGTKLDSNCTATYKVLKITQVTLPSDDVSFTETNDHSKWAVSYDHMLENGKVLKYNSLQKWTCVGDINRMISQFTRGGGTLCLQNSSVWTSFYNSVTGYDPCAHLYFRKTGVEIIVSDEK